MKATPASELKDASRWRQGRSVRVAGIAICRQRPGTASGIVFITLEDETGIANLIVRPSVYERYRSAARHGITLFVEGRVERKDKVIHIMTQRLTALDDQMPDLIARSRDFH